MSGALCATRRVLAIWSSRCSLKSSDHVFPGTAEAHAAPLHASTPRRGKKRQKESSHLPSSRPQLKPMRVHCTRLQHLRSRAASRRARLLDRSRTMSPQKRGQGAPLNSAWNLCNVLLRTTMYTLTSRRPCAKLAQERERQQALSDALV